MAKKQESEPSDSNGPNVNGVNSGGGDTNPTKQKATVGTVKKLKPQSQYDKTEMMDVDLNGHSMLLGNFAPSHMSSIADVRPRRGEFGNDSYETLSLENLIEILDEIKNKSVSLSNSTQKQMNIQIIKCLCDLEPGTTSEDLRRLKQSMLRIEDYLSKSVTIPEYIEYLRLVFGKMFTQDNLCYAICVFLNLFEEKMINEAVNSLMELEGYDEHIKKAVTMMCAWLQKCNFCSNLHIWIVAVLKGLINTQRNELHLQIVLENVSQLFTWLYIPAQRDRITPVLYHMLLATEQPKIFLKVRQVMPKVLNIIRKENTSAAAEFCQYFVNIAHALNVRYFDEQDSKEISALFEEFPPTDAYMQLINAGSYNNFAADNTSLDSARNRTNCKVGLTNLGNTCYMNSVLQALVMTKRFSREILFSKSPSAMVAKLQEQIALMLFSKRFELTPSLGMKPPPGFIDGQQQDSSEFLIYLLQELHDQEVRSYDHYEAYRKMIAKLGRTGKVSTPPPAALASIAAKTTVENTFTGKLATIYRCLTCQVESRNVDSFRELQLSFQEGKIDGAVSNYSVQDLIEYYCSPEKLNGENQYFCENCKELTDAERYITVINAPKNLILTLKQFKYDQKCHRRAKLMHKVYHDEQVSMKLCSTDSCNEIGTVQYDLYAAVVHVGSSMDTGHYYTYAADECNNWYKFDDSIVSESKIEDLHNLVPPNTPYILFYQMSARSENLTSSSTSLVKVDQPAELSILDLPYRLRHFVDIDNASFEKEVNSLSKNNGKSNYGGNKWNNRDPSNNDDDDDPPRPTSGCHPPNNFNSNSFVF